MRREQPLGRGIRERSLLLYQRTQALGDGVHMIRTVGTENERCATKWNLEPVEVQVRVGARGRTMIGMVMVLLMVVVVVVMTIPALARLVVVIVTASLVVVVMVSSMAFVMACMVVSVLRVAKVQDHECHL